MSKFRNPYIVLATGYVIGVLLNMFITSATGLGLLLMATMYPIFRGLGLSRLSAAAGVATTGALELGPTQSNVIYAANQAGLDLTDYVFDYQLWVVIPAMIAVAVLHVVWQPLIMPNTTKATTGRVSTISSMATPSCRQS
jgi:DcuC family C4-dicarboxylate transporter